MKTPQNIFLSTLIFSLFVSVFGTGSVLVLWHWYGILPLAPRSDSSVSVFQPLPIGSRGSGSIEDMESRVIAVSTAVSPSVVSIIISKDIPVYRADPFGFFYHSTGTIERPVGGGSGIFVTRDGLVLTNKHVVVDTDATYTIITSDEEEYIGKVIALDPLTDLAIIQAYTATKQKPHTLPVNFVEHPDSIGIGSFVIAIGNALAEFQNTVSFGIVSGIGRTIDASGEGQGEGSDTLFGLIQTDAAINPWNSGGPLVNLDAKVVGINTAIAAGATGLGFAIPLSASEVSSIVKSVEKYGKIQRSFIGIRYRSITEKELQKIGVPWRYGILIAGDTQHDRNAIISGSPASKAWLQEGDIILEIDGIPVGPTTHTLQNIVKTKFPWDTIILKVYKASSQKTESVTVVLVER